MGVFTDGGPGTGRRGFLAVMIVAVYMLGCGGGTGSENDSAGGSGDSVISSNGVEFRHNGYYTDEELSEALPLVDEYFGLALECAVDVHPELAGVIMSLPGSELTVNVVTPDKYDPSTGREGFSCKFSEKGCAGEFHLGSARIDVPPSLDALGHEIAHWVNYMLFGDTHDDDPDDLSNICEIPSYCHLYSEKRNLISCRE
ncbi:MAG: hypothetical protein AB1598_05180 [Thermodesulfobacteriota bacterium]